MVTATEPTVIGDAWAAEYCAFVAACRAPRLRSISDFAEQELVFPTGPYAGRRFSRSSQPFAGLYLDTLSSAHQSRKWNRFCVTGPSQTGKSLLGFVLPCLYHLFEMQETVILGVPDMDLAGDKWREDILPAIECSRYRDQLPREGTGSRGGAKVESVRFRNGRTLKFMSGGGGDKSRAAFTSRVLVVTETDGFDVSSEASREADKFSQLEARTRAFGGRKCVYLECTVSTAEGRTWREYQSGTASRIVRPCPHCREWVTPERANLVGWQDSETIIQARAKSHFACPACGQAWTEDQRRAANERGKILHRGQSADRDGIVVGELPETDTLGFRWSAVDNHFATASDLGADEWIASHETDEANSERRMCQFVWATPPAPTRVEDAPLSVGSVMARMDQWPRGIVPAWTEHLTVGVDMGKWKCHWIAVAWSQGGRGHVVDYGVLRPESGMLDEDTAIYAALAEFRDEMTSKGWTWEDHETAMQPSQVWVDSGDFTRPVYRFCLDAAGQMDWASHVYRPTKGQGSGQRRQKRYYQPGARSQVIARGDGWHMAYLLESAAGIAGVCLAEVDSDQWKTWGRQRLWAPLDAPVPEGSSMPAVVTLYKAGGREHIRLAQHLTAEKPVEDFEPGKGKVIRWEVVRSDNHWFDAFYLSCAAASFCGVELLPIREIPQKQQQEAGPRVTTPDGRPFFILDR